MRPHGATSDRAAPPSFAEARNPRQKVRAAGLDPSYWYPVEYDRALKPGQVLGVQFWGRSIALYRGSDGLVRALEDRCAHRQLKLSAGEVVGCQLTCTYHGWTYDGQGRVVSIPHELFGREMPSFKVEAFPVQVRYGLIWIFPGEPTLAVQRQIPEIPELEGPDRWACVPIDFTWRAHHSMIIDNVSDFTHAYLHRKYRPFDNARLTKLEALADRVLLSYDTLVGAGRLLNLFMDRSGADTESIDLCYEYPYQWSNTGGKYRHWCFLLPIDRTTTRVFFLICAKTLKIPFTPFRLPRWLVTPAARLGCWLAMLPALKQDGWAVEAEQEGYEAHYDAPLAELNPAVRLFQELTISRWEAYLAQTQEAQPSAPRAAEGRLVRHG